jgi:hypothetical protein
MPEPDDDHQQHVVLDGVDDAIVADPDAKARSTLKSARAWRAWILREQRDGPLDPSANRRVQFA